jgi:hypothetical protein
MEYILIIIIIILIIILLFNNNIDNCYNVDKFNNVDNINIEKFTIIDDINNDPEIIAINKEILDTQNIINATEKELQEATKKVIATQQDLDDDKANIILLNNKYKLSQTEIHNKMCNNSIPPCNAGYIKDIVTDPQDSKKAYECCFIDPNRNDPKQIDTALGIVNNIVQNMLVGEARDVVVKLADRALKNPGKGVQLGERVATKVGTVLQKIKSSGKIGKLLVDKTTKIISKFSSKFAAKIQQVIIQKTGQKLATKLGGMAAKSVTKAGMGPIGWAMLAFDIFSFGLDMADPGDFDNLTSLKELTDARDKTLDEFKNKMLKIYPGIKFPIIYGPLAKLSDAEIIQKKNKLLSDITYQYYEELLTTPAYVNATHTLSELEHDELLNKIADRLEKKLMSDPKYEETIMGILCNQLNGITIDGECSYKNRTDCDKSYDWDKMVKAIKSATKTTTDASAKTEQYVEWKKDRCIITDPTIRKICDDKNEEQNQANLKALPSLRLTYNYDNQVCNITKDYCTYKGMDYITNKEGLGDCKLNLGQNIGEMLFGTTVIRGLRSLFDKNNYGPCNEGDFDLDFEKLPDPIQKVFNVIDKILNMGSKILPGSIFTFLQTMKLYIFNFSGLLCFRFKGNCPNGFESGALSLDKLPIKLPNIPNLPFNTGDLPNAIGLCYPKCKDQFTSDGFSICSKQYPGREGRFGNTAYHLGKDSYSEIGISKSTFGVCNDGQEEVTRGAALCYNKCRPGYNSALGVTCWRQCTSNQVEVGVLCRDKCKPDYNDILGVCWAKKCPPNSDATTLGMCMEKCRDGYTNNIGVCWANKCPAGSFTTTAGMCMDECRAGYKNVLGVCWKNCEQDRRDDGTACWKDFQSYGKGCCCTKYGCCNVKCKPGFHDDGGCMCQKHADKYYKDKYIARSTPLPSYPRRSFKLDSYVNGTITRDSYGNGGGNPKKCPPSHPDESTAGLCNKKCKAGYRWVGGKCWEDCPIGSKDIGLLCERESYWRGMPIPKFGVYFKTRKIPFGKKKD